MVTALWMWTWVLAASAPAFALTGVVRDSTGKGVHEGVVYWDGPDQPIRAVRHVDQDDFRFVPRILPVVKGDRVVFGNSDLVGHNVFSPSKCCAFDLGTWDAGEERTLTVEEEGTIVVLCNVHLEMVSYGVVVPNPHFALLDKSGRFELSGLPAGAVTLRLWRPRMAIQEESFQIEDDSAAVQWTLGGR